jgi:hypothetical protein
MATSTLRDGAFIWSNLLTGVAGVSGADVGGS